MDNIDIDLNQSREDKMKYMSQNISFITNSQTKKSWESLMKHESVIEID